MKYRILMVLLCITPLVAFTQYDLEEPVDTQMFQDLADCLGSYEQIKRHPLAGFRLDVKHINCPEHHIECIAIIDTVIMIDSIGWRVAVDWNHTIYEVEVYEGGKWKPGKSGTQLFLQDGRSIRIVKKYVSNSTPSRREVGTIYQACAFFSQLRYDEKQDVVILDEH